MGELKKPRNLNSLADGQLALGQMLYPKLRPTYGSIDESGGNRVGKYLERTELRYIFWANFFGPKFVEGLGRKFLLDAPGWKKQELDDGGILYVVEEKFLDFWRKKSKAPVDYFRSQVPGIKVFRAKSQE
jgi:hypothetical protein